MYQLLLRTFSFERPRRQVPPAPACEQLLLELPLRLLQQAGGDGPLLELLPRLADFLGAETLSLLLPRSNAPGWRRLGTAEGSEQACPGMANYRCPAACSCVVRAWSAGVFAPSVACRSRKGARRYC